MMSPLEFSLLAEFDWDINAPILNRTEERERELRMELEEELRNQKQTVSSVANTALTASSSSVVLSSNLSQSASSSSVTTPSSSSTQLHDMVRLFASTVMPTSCASIVADYVTLSREDLANAELSRLITTQETLPNSELEERINLCGPLARKITVQSGALNPQINCWGNWRRLFSGAPHVSELTVSNNTFPLIPACIEWRLSKLALSCLLFTEDHTQARALGMEGYNECDIQCRTLVSLDLRGSTLYIDPDFGNSRYSFDENMREAIGCWFLNIIRFNRNLREIDVRGVTYCTQREGERYPLPLITSDWETLERGCTVDWDWLASDEREAKPITFIRSLGVSRNAVSSGSCGSLSSAPTSLNTMQHSFSKVNI